MAPFHAIPTLWACWALAAVARGAAATHRLALVPRAASFPDASCAEYHGATADGSHLYSMNETCPVFSALTTHIAPLDLGEEAKAGRVWLSFASSAVDADVFGRPSSREEWQAHLRGFLRSVQEAAAPRPGSQMVLRAGAESVADPLTVLISHGSTYVVSVSADSLPRFVSNLPPDVEVVSHSPSPLAAIEPRATANAIQRLVNATSSIRLSPAIQLVTSSLSSRSWHEDACTISGEAPGSGWRSRHSFSTGIRVAQAWYQKRMEAAGGRCDHFDYMVGFAPAVICKYKGTEPRFGGGGRVVLSAHFDSRGTFGEVDAPGADDDGSGSAMLLSVAEAIHSHRLKLKRDLYLIAFTGEEQGLWASRHLANQWKAEDVDVGLMLHADMIAYRKPGEAMQMAFPNRMFTPEAADFVGNVSMLYQPSLSLGTTPACCSDQQSFYSAGYPAVWVFERHGPIADPMYHNSGDRCRRPGYDPEQAITISKVLLASVLEFAGFAFAE